MRACARIEAVVDGHGGTKLATLSGQPPLLPRRTGPDPAGLGAPGFRAPASDLADAGAGDADAGDGAAASGARPAYVHLVGGAAGPLGGDALRIDVVVGPGARLYLGSIAATIALPGRDGHTSRLTVAVQVAAGGHLYWRPEPLVAARGCRHHTVSIVDLEAGAGLEWREELVCGRHDEESGDVTLSTTVRYAGRTLYRNDLAVGPGAPGWNGPAVLGTARASGTLLVVDPAWESTGPPAAAAIGPGTALMPLAGPAVLLSTTGTDVPEVRAALTGSLLVPA